MIKASGPHNLREKYNIDSLIQLFEVKLKHAEESDTYQFLIIEGEYNRTLLDLVEKEYREAGWVYVKARTSTESGERPGLTGLQLSMIAGLIKPSGNTVFKLYSKEEVRDIAVRFCQEVILDEDNLNATNKSFDAWFEHEKL